MKQIVFTLLLLQQTVFATTYTLKHILDKAEKHNDLSKAINQEKLSLDAKNRAGSASDPLSFYAEGTRARPAGGNDGNEYAVAFSKQIRFADIQEQEREIGKLANEGYLLDAQKQVLNYRNGLKNFYHQHCLDLQNYRSFKESYLDFLTLIKKKEKAYLYKEISRAELMQLETEKNRLNVQLQALKMEMDISKETLLILSKVGNASSVQLSCRDLYPVRSRVGIGKKFALSAEAYEKRLHSTEKAIQRYSNGFDEVSLSAQYTNELDVDRYTIGVSIPLNFSSEKYEQEKVSAMYQNSAIRHRYAQSMTERKSLFRSLEMKLKSQAQMYRTLKQNAKNYSKKVLPLIQSSYDLGETSVIEFLLSKQKWYQLREEVFLTKKAYYKTLFNLYTVSEQKDNL